MNDLLQTRSFGTARRVVTLALGKCRASKKRTVTLPPVPPEESGSKAWRGECVSDKALPGAETPTLPRAVRCQSIWTFYDTLPLAGRVELQVFFKGLRLAVVSVPSPALRRRPSRELEGVNRGRCGLLRKSRKQAGRATIERYSKTLSVCIFMAGIFSKTQKQSGRLDLISSRQRTARGTGSPYV